MRTHHAIVCAASILIVCGVVSPAAAQENWKGEKVMPKKRAKEIKFGDRVNGEQVSFPFSDQELVFTVIKDSEGWLRIFDGEREGWADKDDFILAKDGSAYFHRRLQENPNDTWALYRRGVGWALKGEPDNAIQDFNECVRVNPTDHNAYNARGNAWSNKKDYDKAIADYNEAIRLNPTSALAFYNRGNRWSNKKDYDKAIADYNEAIRFNPKYVSAYNNRGVAWLNKKDYDRALADYNEAIRINPKIVFAFLNRGDAWRSKKDYDKAIADYNEAIRLNPKYVDAFNNKAYLLATCANDRLRDIGKAKELFEVVVKLRPTSPYNEETLAVIAAAEGRFDDAIKHQQKALEDKEYASWEGEKARERLKLFAEKKPCRE